MYRRIVSVSVATVLMLPSAAAQNFGILQELDTCDVLGVPGMTVSSDDHCVQVRGGVSYDLEIGQFRDEVVIARTSHDTKIAVGRYAVDWNTKVKSWLKLINTSETDYGPSKAVVSIGKEEEAKFWGSAVGYTDSGPHASTRGNNILQVDEAYIEIGDATKLMVGRRGSAAIFGDDRPFNYLSLFNTSSYEGGGVGIDNDSEQIGGHVIQGTANLGTNWRVAGGLEALGSNTGGTAVGSIAYYAEGISAHVTGLLFDLNQQDKSWMLHAGSSAYFADFSLRSAVAYHKDADTSGQDRLDAMVSAEAKYKIFTLALSSELIHSTDVGGLGFLDYGFGASVGFTLHKYVSANLGGRVFVDGDAGLYTGQLGGQVNATMTEVFSVGAEAGVYFGSKLAEQRSMGALANEVIGYAGGYVNMTPGGGVTGFMKAEGNTEGAYKVTTRLGKEFK